MTSADSLVDETTRCRPCLTAPAERAPVDTDRNLKKSVQLQRNVASMRGLRACLVSEIFLNATITISLLFDKYYLIID
jgi:hypothetical protein